MKNYKVACLLTLVLISPFCAIAEKNPFVSPTVVTGAGGSGTGTSEVYCVQSYGAGSKGWCDSNKKCMPYNGSTGDGPTIVSPTCANESHPSHCTAPNDCSTPGQPCSLSGSKICYVNKNFACQSGLCKSLVPPSVDQEKDTF